MKVEVTGVLLHGRDLDYLTPIFWQIPALQYFCIWVDFKSVQTVANDSSHLSVQHMPRPTPLPAPPPPPPPPPFTHKAFTTQLLYQKVTETFHEAP